MRLEMMLDSHLGLALLASEDNYLPLVDEIRLI